MSQTITTSPDISLLDFSVLYDISTATPAITITNLSAGPHLNLCIWWVQILSPSNTPIHEGSADDPDENGNWTTFTPSEPWPQPFNQIEFSGVNPYSTTLFVQDSEGNIFSLTKTGIICRPNGNSDKSIGNFGTALFGLTFQWQTAQLYAQDNTNYYYEKQLGSIVSRTWVLDYPRDENNNLPDPITISNTPTALFPLGVTGDGYGLYLSTIMIYSIGEASTVKIAYKNNKIFPVWYGLDICSLMCELDKVYASAEMTESAVLNPMAQQKLLKINTLLQKCWMGILQPLCGIDVPAIVQQIEELGCIKCNWVKGINGANPTGMINIIKGTMCGDIDMTIAQTGNNYTINAKDWKYILKTCDDIPTTAFTFDLAENSGTCTRTYCLNVDLTQLKTDLGINSVILPVYLHSTTTPPSTCPSGYFPCNVYNVADTAIIGIATSIDDLIGILNSDATWLAKGTAFNMGNCKVGFNITSGQTTPGATHVDLDVVNPPCTNNTRTYQNTLQPFCDDALPITALSYPFRGSVQYVTGGPKYNIGIINTYDELITALNAESHKPGTITFKKDTININSVDVIIYDANCSFTSYIITIYGDVDQIVHIGSNNNMNVFPFGGAYYQNDLLLTEMGKICDSVLDANARPWHLIKSPLNNNFLFYLETDTGKLVKINVTNPLYPTVVNSVLLPTTMGTGTPATTPFSGLPKYSGTIFSHWDVYIGPTDANTMQDGQYLYIMESTTGCIWKYDMLTDTVSDSFFDVRLVGKCPRTIWNGGLATNYLYFSHDGNRETTTGQNSTVPRKDLLYLDLSNFASAGISVISMTWTAEECWSINRNTSDTLSLTTLKGGVYTLDPSSHTIIASHPGLFGADFTGSSLINTVFARVGAQDGGVTTAKIFASSDVFGTWFVDMGTLLPLGQFAPDASITLVHHNFLIIPGECYGLVTYDNGIHGGVAKYDYFGNFIAKNALTQGSFYNVITYKITGPATPNGLC